MRNVRFRLPIRAALTLVGAAYLARAFLNRGGDTSPDLPGDLVVAAVLLGAIALVVLARAKARDESSDEHAPPEDPEKGHASGHGG
jgi:hypothetical protein